MIDRGIPLKKTVAICYVLTAVYAAIGLLASQMRTRYSLAVIVVVFAISELVIWKKGLFGNSVFSQQISMFGKFPAVDLACRAQGHRVKNRKL